jgi:arabinogalactan endo-1,4-beta-galactosidase
MSSQTHHDNISAQLTGILKANATQAAMTNGSFTYTEGEMRTLIKNWHDLADSYQKSLQHALFMARIESPAEDFASRAYTDAANQSGKAYERYLEHNRAYCEQQAQMLQDVLDEYLGVEHANTTEIEKTAPQGPQPGV